LADGDSTDRTVTGETDTREDLSPEAKKVLGAVLILERAHVHQDRPRIRKDLTDLIKNHVR